MEKTMGKKFGENNENPKEEISKGNTIDFNFANNTQNNNNTNNNNINNNAVFDFVSPEKNNDNKISENKKENNPSINLNDIQFSSNPVTHSE